MDAIKEDCGHIGIHADDRLDAVQETVERNEARAAAAVGVTRRSIH